MVGEELGSPKGFNSKAEPCLPVPGLQNQKEHGPSWKREEEEQCRGAGGFTPVTEDAAQVINSPWKPSEDNEAKSNCLY